MPNSPLNGHVLLIWPVDLQHRQSGTDDDDVYKQRRAAKATRLLWEITLTASSVLTAFIKVEEGGPYITGGGPVNHEL